MIYRVKQFLNAIFATITEKERTFYRQYLSKQEADLFEKLKVYDQKHSLRVAAILSEKTGGNVEMIRLGLLHDIGKQIYPLSPIQKGIMVILDKLSKGKVQQYSGLKMVKGYYEHAQLGYELLNSTGSYEKSFLNVIKSHHVRIAAHRKGSLNINIDEKRYLLQEADDRA